MTWEVRLEDGTHKYPVISAIWFTNSFTAPSLALILDDMPLPLTLQLTISGLLWIRISPSTNILALRLTSNPIHLLIP